MNRRTTRRAGAAATLLATLLAVTGCGATDALVGLHPAPAEQTSAAPLDAEGARAIAARLLDGARAAAAEKGPKGDAARAEVLSGDALTVANAAAARGVVPAASGELAKEAEPTVVAQSRGRGWPRAILVTTLDEATSTQYLHVLVSESPQAPFTITASVPMLGGAELPAIGGDRMGAPFVDLTDGEGLPVAPERAFADYAAALAVPKPATVDTVATDDTFTTALRTSAAAQATALGKLGVLTQKHTPDLEHAVAFRLADGGVVAFGLLRRADAIAVRPGAKELVLPADVAGVVGRKKAAKSVQLTSLEPVVLVVPTDGPARVIAASELVASGKAA
ncbi:MAG TPA: hypothetical protein VFL46_11645 [Phycicoccus sp.]|nr:hypothetical protein [Phycicoccus sp.]